MSCRQGCEPSGLEVLSCMHHSAFEGNVFPTGCCADGAGHHIGRWRGLAAVPAHQEARQARGQTAYEIEHLSDSACHSSAACSFAGIDEALGSAVGGSSSGWCWGTCMD